MHYIVKKLMILGLGFYTTNLYAMTIDYMLLASDEFGNGAFTLTNSNDYTNYITADISELKITDDGELLRVPYEKENLDDWLVTVTHPKFILEPGISQKVGVRSLCGKECNLESDKVFQIMFVPAPYLDEGEEASSLYLNFGYSATYIIPAQEPNIDYKIVYEGDKLTFENTGNTYVRFMINSCRLAKSTSNCKITKTVLAGRSIETSIPESMSADYLELLVVNSDDTYREFENVKKKIQ